MGDPHPPSHLQVVVEASVDPTNPPNQPLPVHPIDSRSLKILSGVCFVGFAPEVFDLP
jgi:hypothetical protein